MNSITPITSLVDSLTRIFREKESGYIRKPEEITPVSIEKTLKGLDLVIGRGSRLVQFVQNYREVTRLPKPRFETVNVRGILQQVADLEENTGPESGVPIEVDCDSFLQMQGDPGLLEQVLINLVKNAAEALSGMEGARIRISAKSVQDAIVIEVEDNGPGIPESILDDIFIPFFTTKPTGSGIGLSLSRQIIRLHGGSLEAVSVPGKTVFTIRI
jgi:signal transduction histidine kinase